MTHAPRTGIWLIGARGSVATTTMVGCAALVAGLHPPTGMATETPELADAGLPPLAHLVFGGHDTTDCPLPKRAEQLTTAGVLPYGLTRTVTRELEAADREIRPGGPAPGDTRTDEQLITAFTHDLTDFRRRIGLDRVVVVNVASTEPASGGVGLPPSTLYAAAALRAGCPYVNFTPSTGIRHPALAAPLAASRLPHAGRDGKTGQTLLRAVLAPMFRQRALTVRAWSGSNLLGGGDGAALADPAAAAAKNAGKERVLTDTLGHGVEGQVHIDDVPAMGEWKTAWDHIAFDGFLGTRMILQTLWQGCDSALAAPLVLDLARLTARAHEKGVTGPLEDLAFYFKDPEGTPPAALADQYDRLLTFGRTLGDHPGPTDAETADAGSLDAGTPDAGPTDAEPADADPGDTGSGQARTGTAR
ncbi:inositol-3-phosphate synthase [Streptomyces sp. CB02009]|uniref:inositol-3-phosphate synthase n=1 Tax=Streptomyces sp. CB02009 TaxID=1703938 RepID=UPI000AC77209|nr:inositol-3-phosphate synthase [Streptomyces sp. CB02009]